jgi:hypothetical protein
MGHPAVPVAGTLRYVERLNDLNADSPSGRDSGRRAGASRKRPDPLHHQAVPGEIVATDNGDPTSFMSFASHEREAFNGLALVIVRARPGGERADSGEPHRARD